MLMTVPALVCAGPSFRELSESVYADFAAAAEALRHDGEELDRLSVFARLAETPGAAQRRELWLALQPVWQAVNGANEPDSAYRRLVALRAAELRALGQQPGDSVRAIGVDPADMERWLYAALEAWRDSQPAHRMEPWDYAWQAGAAARALAPALPREALLPLTRQWYGALGADLEALNVQFDLVDRPGKDPVAYTDFGRRPARVNGRWDPGEPQVSATYQSGGLDNLYELMHEAGHAVHIAAIRTAPEQADWPDSDIFTEALAELAALDVFEPAWQAQFLERSAYPLDAHRAQYAATVMDMAWALFELRMLRDPTLDPNQVWTELTGEYLHIKPHPEYAWWAVRGQLVEAPGYMMNYAAGAFLAADLRARARELWGEPLPEDPCWYARMSATLFRFGLEKPSREVIEHFLGRPVSPQALMEGLGAASGAPVAAAAR